MSISRSAACRRAISRCWRWPITEWNFTATPSWSGTGFAAEKPEAVRGFWRAYLKVLKDTVRDPVRAVEAVLHRSDDSAKAVELERLRLAIGENVVTGGESGRLRRHRAGAFRRGTDQLTPRSPIRFGARRRRRRRSTPRSSRRRRTGKVSGTASH
jgi:hypothetical protein